jgi:pilus assembly protein CpaE
MNVLISGRVAADVRSVESHLKGLSKVRLSTHLMDDAANAPWPDTDAPPEALILVLEGGWTRPLRGLAEQSKQDCPPLVVVGPGNDLELMRLAMRCGARDFLAAPADAGDLKAVIGRIADERREASGSADGSLTAVVNAKGGAGGSLIACNVAHMMAAELKLRTTLVDLDLQFGVLPLYFDLQANDGLLQAIDTVDTLDEVAVEGWMLKHHSGLHILASSHQQLILPGEVPEAGVGALMSLLKRAYPQVVVDLPRQIDPVFAAVVERADQVVVVIQQSLADLRHAKSLLMILTGRLGLDRSQIQFVVNRWEKNGTLREREIEQALDGARVATLPNDWLRVTRSLDIGTPLLDEDPRAPITRGMSEMAARLAGAQPIEKKGLFGRFMSR